MRLHLALRRPQTPGNVTMSKTPPAWSSRGFLLCRPLYIMLVLLVIAAASAATTWLVIKAGRDVANDEFLVKDLMYILVAQSASHAIGAISWIYAERAGMPGVRTLHLPFRARQQG